MQFLSTIMRAYAACTLVPKPSAATNIPFWRPSKSQCQNVPQSRVQPLELKHQKSIDAPRVNASSPAKETGKDMKNLTKYWICLLGAATISNTTSKSLPSATDWTCVFCLSSQPNKTDMVNHLVKEHNIHICQGKKVEARTFYRKDKLKQHLQQVHKLAETSSSLWELWHQSPKKKWAWGCGFCGCCLFTWEGKYPTFHYSSDPLLFPTTFSACMAPRWLVYIWFARLWVR